MGYYLSKIFCLEPTNPNSQVLIKPQVQPSQQDLTIINLKNLRDDLFNQKKRMNLSIQKTESEIKAHLVKKNKESALYAIKRKKLFEEYLSTADDKYLFINKAIMEVEKSICDKDLNDVMKQTNGLLKDIQKSIDLEVIEEMKENFAVVDEQKNAFNNLFNQYNIKDELDDEYNKYEAEIAKDQFNEIEKNQVKVKEIQNNHYVSNEKNIDLEKNNDNTIEEKLIQLE